MAEYGERLPEPGIGPFVTLNSLKVGTNIMGMAPIGIRWRATIALKNGKKVCKPEGNCPAGEFLPTNAFVDGCWKELKV
jgi:hypothetical protein